MQGPRDYLAGLAQLAGIDGAEERRRVWRQGLASLAMAASNQRVAPLEALPPERLLESVRVAFRTGLVDDVRWMSPGLAAAAFFEIATALPGGDEKRELGRRVLESLLTGDAATFALLATSLAGASRRGLSTPPVRARVAVAMRLPIGIETGVDRLALALLCRPDLEREWLATPSSGPLPARRVSARLLERAAREAVRRGLEGDDVGVKTLRRPSVRAAFQRLLADRESLVWRHVASARGLLAAIDGSFVEEIERGLNPHLGPTEWRRAATSLGASVAHAPTVAVARCQQLIEGDLLRRDPGLGACLVFGLSRAATVEPEAVEALLPLLLESGDLECIEAFVDLLGEHPGWRLAGRATTLALDRLRAAPSHRATTGWRRCAGCSTPSCRRWARAGGRRCASRSWPRRWPSSRGATCARTSRRRWSPPAWAWACWSGMPTDTAARSGQRAFQILRELDRGLLESSVLADLLMMVGMNPTSRGPGDLGDLIARLRTWLIEREQDAPVARRRWDGAESPYPSSSHRSLTPMSVPLTSPVPEMHRRRLRALVHAIDGEGFAQWDETIAGTRERRLRALDRLLSRLAAGADAGRAPAAVRRPGPGLRGPGARRAGRDVGAGAADVRPPARARGLHRAGRGHDGARAEGRLPGGGRADAPAGRAAVPRARPPPPPSARPAAPVAALPGAGRAAAARAGGAGRGAAPGAGGHLADAGAGGRRRAPCWALMAGPAAGSLDRLGECVQDVAELGTGVWRRLGQPERRRTSAGAARSCALDAALLHAVRGDDADLAGAVQAAMAGRARRSARGAGRGDRGACWRGCRRCRSRPATPSDRQGQGECPTPRRCSCPPGCRPAA